MRTFGRLEVSIWQNYKFHEFSDDEKLAWVYLIACPHGNALGCFVLPLGYVAADLRWSVERASEALSKLQQKARIERDERTGMTRVVGWFGHNRIENGNVAKGILAALSTLPRCFVLANAINALLTDGGHFVEPLREPFERALEDLPKSFEPPEPEPEPEPEPDNGGSGHRPESDTPPQEHAAAPNGAHQQKSFAFSGAVIRLTGRDYKRWQEAYPDIDLKAELTALDDYYRMNLAPKDRGNWFARCSQALASRQERAVSCKPKSAQRRPYRDIGAET